MKKSVVRNGGINQKTMPSSFDPAMNWDNSERKEFLRLMTQYKCAMIEIETRINLLKEEYILEVGRTPVSSIKTRLKTPQSIKEKLTRRGYDPTPLAIQEQLNDVAGVRVICPFLEDVYSLAEALLLQDDVILVRKKDYIANPKENGYRSLHFIVMIPVFLAREKKMVKVEIQFRTLAMDFWASLEHQLRYKSDATVTDAMGEELLQCAQLSADLDRRMDQLRKSIDTDPDFS